MQDPRVIKGKKRVSKQYWIKYAQKLKNTPDTQKRPISHVL